ncbi:hypothetical protein C8Z91_18745 [Paenibacillus elgii]|uniref:Uncharacterized protein n=1 Tax=Paenibacillus elgii TaxID=189691 RepID=A0A2T6G0V6_9BACL|nr:hypothetical protein [Paenibacillus elgii]PUA37768.1 hypothetical protein C8Z91_18745 [Paenibacillus elgii]
MKKPSHFVYRNARYGFTLRFPAWWRTYAVIDRRRQSSDTEYELHFRFRYKGKVYDDALAIMVFHMTRQEWNREGYDDSPLIFLAEHGGRVFAYMTPEELPEAFYDPKTNDYDYKRYGAAIRLLKRMVNQDAPRIAGSIRFLPQANTARSVPYRAQHVCTARTGDRGKQRCRNNGTKRSASHRH